MMVTWYLVLCSFIHHSTSTRRLQSDLFGLWVKLPPVTTSLTTQRYTQSR